MSDFERNESARKVINLVRMSDDELLERIERGLKQRPSKKGIQSLIGTMFCYLAKTEDLDNLKQRLKVLATLLFD